LAEGRNPAAGIPYSLPSHGIAGAIHILAQANLANKIESFFEKIDAVLESFEVRFASDDWLGWAASFFTWIGDLVPATQPPSPVAAAIGNNFNIGVLGDFGTGRYGAPMCQKSIDSSGDAYDLMLHLGDVYYSATDDEVAQRFVKFWPTIFHSWSRRTSRFNFRTRRSAISIGGSCRPLGAYREVRAHIAPSKLSAATPTAFHTVPSWAPDEKGLRAR
jgi:hypothetical protein